MAKHFGVTPHELRATSKHLEQVSTAMKDLLAELRAKLVAEGAPWGDCEVGDQFAKGPGGYLAQLDWVDDSVAAKTGLLDFYARGLHEAANRFEQADHS